MHRSGILILTQHVSSLCHGDAVKHIVAGIKGIVKSTLYVHVANTFSPRTPDFNKESDFNLPALLNLSSQSSNHSDQFSDAVFPFLSKFYSEAAIQCRDLDVSILLHNIGHRNLYSHQLRWNVDCIISDCNPATLNDEVSSTLQQFVSSCYLQGSIHSALPVVLIPSSSDHSPKDFETHSERSLSSNGSVVIGGTFDHIHFGHKVLLSEATLLTEKRLLIGLTDGEMLKRKTLYDLIKPWTERNKQLKEFLCDVAKFVSKDEINNTEAADNRILEIVRITDPIGPASTDTDLQCIVVSNETRKGGEVVNAGRDINGLNALSVHVIGQGNLVGDEKGSGTPTKEEKLSSSTIRFNSLGSLRQSPNLPDTNYPKEVYVIGLTGGIASGKSSIASHLQKLGAVVIDCDKLGHAAYEPGTDCFDKVVQRFGADIVGQSGVINRKTLAQKVFVADSDGKHSNLQDLNNIVWPEIERLARLQITDAVNNTQDLQSKKLVCVLDAAVLLEAKWDKFCNEVWVCVIPTAEAVKRIERRDGRSTEEAEKRINAQMTGRERVEKAHVVLSTLWEREVTINQVKKAWDLLLERLH